MGNKKKPRLNKCQPLKEGWPKKGGLNDPPSTPRPKEAPKPMGARVEKATIKFIDLLTSLTKQDKLEWHNKMFNAHVCCINKNLEIWMEVFQNCENAVLNIGGIEISGRQYQESIEKLNSAVWDQIREKNPSRYC